MQIAETDNFDDFGVDLYPIRKANSSISYNSTNNDAARLYFSIIFSLLLSNISFAVLITQQEIFYCVFRRYKETERGYIEPEGSAISEAIQGGRYFNFIFDVFGFLSLSYLNVTMFRFRSRYNSWRN